MSHTPYEHAPTDHPYDWAADPAAFDTAPEAADTPQDSPLEQLLDKLQVLAGRGENTGEAKHLISDLKGSTFSMRGCDYKIVSIRYNAAGEPLVGAEAMGENARNRGLQFYTIQDIEAARIVDAEVAQARQARLVREEVDADPWLYEPFEPAAVVYVPRSRTRALVSKLAYRLAAHNQRLREAREAEVASSEPLDVAPQRESWRNRATRVIRGFGRGGVVAVSPETVTLAGDEYTEAELSAQDQPEPLPTSEIQPEATEAGKRISKMEDEHLRILTERNQAEASQPSTQPEATSSNAGSSKLPEGVHSTTESGSSQLGERPAESHPAPTPTKTPAPRAAFEMPFYFGITGSTLTDEERRVVDAAEADAKHARQTPEVTEEIKARALAELRRHAKKT